jgi:hypothetical protein
MASNSNGDATKVVVVSGKKSSKGAKAAETSELGYQHTLVRQRIHEK